MQLSDPFALLNSRRISSDVATMANLRAARLNLRLTPAELALVRWAAHEQRLAVTAGVVCPATAGA